MFDSPGIVETKVLHIQHVIRVRLKHIHRLAESGRVGTWEYALSDPDAEGKTAIATDKMQQAPSLVANRTVNYATQLGVVLPSYMLQHADGDKHVVVAGDIAVIVFHELHHGGQASLRGKLAGHADLLMGDVEGLHPHAIVFGHVHGQRTPAATR